MVPLCSEALANWLLVFGKSRKRDEINNDANEIFEETDNANIELNQTKTRIHIIYGWQCFVFELSDVRA